LKNIARTEPTKHDKMEELLEGKPLAKTYIKTKKWKNM
jgi:hypothetical protein